MCMSVCVWVCLWQCLDILIYKQTLVLRSFGTICCHFSFFPMYLRMNVYFDRSHVQIIVAFNPCIDTPTRTSHTHTTIHNSSGEKSTLQSCRIFSSHKFSCHRNPSIGDFKMQTRARKEVTKISNSEMCTPIWSRRMWCDHRRICRKEKSKSSWNKKLHNTHRNSTQNNKIVVLSGDTNKQLDSYS